MAFVGVGGFLGDLLGELETEDEDEDAEDEDEDEDAEDEEPIDNTGIQ